MQVVSYATPADFLTAAGDRLREDEAWFGLILGIARQTAENPHLYGPDDPWFCTVGDEHGISAAAFRTLPHPPNVSWFGGDAAATAPVLAEALHGRWGDLDRLSGHRDIADPVKDCLCERYGATVKSTMAMTMYRLDAVNDLPAVPGTLRLATEADRDLVLRWGLAFNLDCFGEEGGDRPNIRAELAIKAGNLFFWEDDGPACMVGKTRPSEHGVTIGPVYTPPERRNRGYATATTAAVCREILGSGKEFCVLFADRANPASNAAYLKVGFRVIGDSVEYTFTGKT